MLKKMLNGPSIRALRWGRRGTLRAHIAYSWGLGPPEFSVCLDWVFPFGESVCERRTRAAGLDQASICDPQKRGRGLEATRVIVPLRLGRLYDLHWPKAVSVVQSRVLALWASFSVF